MKKLAFSILIVFTGLILGGCPDKNTTETGTLTVETGQAGLIVFIGSSGSISQTTDAQGIAKFTGLEPGPVDVHIAEPSGQFISSSVGVTENVIIFDTTFGISQIDIYTSVINPDLFGAEITFVTDTEVVNSFVSSFDGMTALAISVPAGSSITGDIYVHQGDGVSTSGNGVRGFSEAVFLGRHTLTTRPWTGTAGTPQLSLSAGFSAIAPVPSTLVMVNSFAAPAGLTIAQVLVGGASISPYTSVNPYASLILPDTIQSAYVGDDTWNVFAFDPYTSDVWSKSGFVTNILGASITPTPLFTSRMTAAKNQSGSMLSWTNASHNSAANSLFTNISIADPYSEVWNISLANGASSFTFPTLPQGLSSPLVAGTTYSLDIINIILVNRSAILSQTSGPLELEFMTPTFFGLGGHTYTP